MNAVTPRNMQQQQQPSVAALLTRNAELIERLQRGFATTQEFVRVTDELYSSLRTLVSELPPDDVEAHRAAQLLVPPLATLHTDACPLPPAHLVYELAQAAWARGLLLPPPAVAALCPVIACAEPAAADEEDSASASSSCASPRSPVRLTAAERRALRQQRVLEQARRELASLALEKAVDDPETSRAVRANRVGVGGGARLARSTSNMYRFVFTCDEIQRLIEAVEKHGLDANARVLAAHVRTRDRDHVRIQLRQWEARADRADAETAAAADGEEDDIDDAPTVTAAAAKSSGVAFRRRRAGGRFAPSRPPVFRHWQHVFE